MTGEVGPGLDFVRYHAGPIAAALLRPGSGGANTRPNGYLRLGARVDFGAVSLEADGLLVVEFFSTHYDVQIGALRSEVLVPAIVQPGLALGGAW